MQTQPGCSPRLRDTVLAIAFGSLFLGALPALSGVLTGNCRVAPQPAATLLIPYFTTDLNNANGATTVISVNNALSKSVLARVTLWTDWGVPTLAFDVYLTGWDIQTFDVRDLLNGKLPTTGVSVSPVGSYSQASSGFPGCSAEPLHAARRDATLPTAEASYLRAAHTGQPLPAAGGRAAENLCAASVHQGGLATGYVTIDTVNRCSPTAIGATANTAVDPAYFVHGGAGIASDENALWGDATFLAGGGRADGSLTAVSLVADADAMTSGSYTFYGRYSNFDGRDDRVPLSSLYFARFTNQLPIGTSDLIVWRDNRVSTVAPVTCGSEPTWSHMGEEQLLVFDEEENGTQIPHSDAFPYTTQRVHVGGAAIPTALGSGFVMLDLWKADSTHAQAWVGVMSTSGPRFNASREAARIDDLCNFGP